MPPSLAVLLMVVVIAGINAPARDEKRVRDVICCCCWWGCKLFI